MERTAVEELLQLEQQYESTCPGVPDQNHRCISLDQYRHLEESLDQMQADNQATHRMLHELSILVSRQLQVRVQ